MKVSEKQYIVRVYTRVSDEYNRPFEQPLPWLLQIRRAHRVLVMQGDLKEQLHYMSREKKHKLAQVPENDANLGD